MAIRHSLLIHSNVSTFKPTINGWFGHISIGQFYGTVHLKCTWRSVVRACNFNMIIFLYCKIQNLFS